MTLLNSDFLAVSEVLNRLLNLTLPLLELLQVQVESLVLLGEFLLPQGLLGKCTFGLLDKVLQLLLLLSRFVQLLC